MGSVDLSGHSIVTFCPIHVLGENAFRNSAFNVQFKTPNASISPLYLEIYRM